MAPTDRAAQIEQRSPLRLPNKISDASPAIARSLTGNVKEEIQQHRPDDPLPRFFLQMATLTSLLPPHWESFPSDLKMFLEKELFDPILRHVLESEGLMNWCSSVRKVHPLITPGDGNCLLHAVSLAMWAVEDDELVLRTALYRLLREDKNERNRMRWQRERMRIDSGIPGSGLMYNSTEWHGEWEMVKLIASPERRPAMAQGLPFESLEQYHIFMLANMLRRPIIVIAQDMMRSQWGHSLQPQNLHGIYLPLNWDPSVCYHYPILLGFHQNHFTPLLCTAKLDSEEDTFGDLFPIVQQDFTPMAVHFLDEDEEKQVDSLLQKYLIVEEIIYMGESLNNAHGILGARLVCKNDRLDLDLMIPYLQLAETHYRSYLEMEYGNATESFVATASSGKANAALVQNTEKPHSLLEQPRSSPSASGHLVSQLAKNSWSGSGAPVSQPSDEAAKARPLASQNPPFNRAFSLVNQSCKTEGCIYYRSVSTGEYCHECFKKQTQSRMCQGERCLNPAEQGCQGLCRVCFDQRKLMETAVTKASAPSLSKMSLDPVANFVPPFAQIGNSCLEYRYAAGSRKPGDDIMATIPLQMPQDQKAPSSGYIAMAANRKDNKAGVNPGQASSPDDELNSFIVHQKLATKKCIIPECPLTGDPNKNDMCGKCYTENLQVVEEIGKSKTLRQPAPATIKTFDQSSSQATTNATSSGASALPQAAAAAAAAASKPHYSEQKPSSRFTVQKNICAKAGCDGVRLVTASYLGYCFNCFNKNKKIPLQSFSRQDPDTSGRNPSTSQNQISTNLPKLGKSQDLFQPSSPTFRCVHSNEVGSNIAVRYKSTQEPKPAEGQLSKVQNPLTSKLAAPTLTTSTATQATPATETSTKRCVHPLCDKPAAPPKFLLCDQCIAIATMYQEREMVGSAGQQAASSAKREQELAEPSQRKEAVKPAAQPAASTTGNAKAPLSKTASGFKNVRISRVECQVPGGCTDNMYGDPELDNLCSRCFAKMSLRRTRTRASPPTCRAETRPTPSPPSPAHKYNTAPLNPSARLLPPKPRAHTEIIYMDRESARQPVVPKRNTLPANFQKCAQPDCWNQANLQILEGFCNSCHQVYRQQGYVPDAPAVNPDPQSVNRGRFAHSSQSTVPEAWIIPQTQGQTSGEKILNTELGAKMPPSAEPNRTDMRCLSIDCTNYGNPRCHGYCNSCFRLLKN